MFKKNGMGRYYTYKEVFFMKRYGICLLLFVVVAAICFGAGYVSSSIQERPGNAISNTAFSTEQLDDELPYQNAAGEKEESELPKQETEQAVVNQRYVEPVVKAEQERYYLVSETGFLLVFAEDRSTICLYTHIPITDFPEKEQDKLREGIWFSSMMEVFHYLESYTS